MLLHLKTDQDQDGSLHMIACFTPKYSISIVGKEVGGEEGGGEGGNTAERFFL